MRHGFEQELQIVEPKYGKLVGEQQQILKFLEKEIESHAFTGVGKEHYQTQVEYRIGIAENPEELESSIKKLRDKIISIAERLNFSIIASGVNPVCLTERAGENFGDHHHIEINSAQEAIDLHNFLRCFIPEFIAISANSPIYNGSNSNYMSFRISRSPHIKCPPVLGEEDLADLINHSLNKMSKKYIQPRYWDVTPFVEKGLPTVEVRVCDAQFSIPIIISISILLQGLLQKLRSNESFIPRKISSAPKNWQESLHDNREIAYTQGIKGLCNLSHRPILPLSEKITVKEAISELIDWLESEINSLCISSAYSVEKLKSILVLENTNHLLLNAFIKKGISGYVKQLIQLTKGE